MNAKLKQLIATFHGRFTAADSVSRIAALYDDEKIREKLPSGRELQYLHYSEYFGGLSRQEHAKNGFSDQWALYVLLSVVCSSDLHTEDLRKCPFGPIISTLPTPTFVMQATLAAKEVFKSTPHRLITAPISNMLIIKEKT